ncbi:MAG: hypothetical protein LBJ00_10680 [Planctomycetaceae bacterium]|nr:hypothetical protein [Planctomycetaceae bacterium]
MFGFCEYSYSITVHRCENSLYSSCFKIPETGHASVTTWSGCSRAKPIYGIKPISRNERQ